MIRICDNYKTPKQHYIIVISQILTWPSLQSVVFPCQKWLGKDSEVDANSQIELMPNVQAQALIKYAIAIRTSDTKGAGTDSNIKLEVYGKEGKVGVFRLDRLDSFSRGQVMYLSNIFAWSSNVLIKSDFKQLTTREDEFLKERTPQ